MINDKIILAKERAANVRAEAVNTAFDVLINELNAIHEGYDKDPTKTEAQMATLDIWFEAAERDLQRAYKNTMAMINIK